jgi:cytochrome c oxidase subunit 2
MEKPGGSTEAGKVVDIKMTAKQFEFSPSTITVKKGETVKLTVTSEDVQHGLSIPDFGVSLSLSPGVPATATFVADKTGTFQFMCNNFCGSGHSGMKGTLVVTE